MYQNLTLLIVDDSLTERYLLKDYVEELNFKSVVEATNGLEGVAMAEKHKPDLILMDVVMPGINGFQATKQILLKPNLKDTPIIMCTSKSEDKDKEWGKRQGAKSYITKPVDKDLLIEAIKNILG
jgi:twitching motility two-component system response regulator PilH